MMISGKQVQSVVRAYRVTATPPVPPTSKTDSVSGKDRVTLSMEGQEVQTVTQRLRELLEVRTERVGTLRKQVASGKYDVSSGEIVDKMLARSVADRLS